jgi:ketosteroid isomerase-like protein
MPSALEEKDAIRELLAEYCFRLDGGDYDGMAALFAEDGVWETDFGKGTGRAGIAGHARDIRARAGDNRPRAVHLTTNIVIALNGEEAEVRSNWTVVQNSPPGETDGPKISSGGGYLDRMVKRNGSWLFRHRKIDRFIAAGKE